MYSVGGLTGTVQSSVGGLTGTVQSSVGGLTGTVLCGGTDCWSLSRGSGSSSELGGQIYWGGGGGEIHTCVLCNLPGTQ